MQARLQRWRSFVAMGLIVAPFLPASNLFFWVGTQPALQHACFAQQLPLPPCLQHGLPYIRSLAPGSAGLSRAAFLVIEHAFFQRLRPYIAVCAASHQLPARKDPSSKGALLRSDQQLG